MQRAEMGTKVRTGEPPRTPSSPTRTRNVERCTDNEWAGPIARVLAGDVNAYEEIYRATDGALRAFVGSRYWHLGTDFSDEVSVRTHEYALSRLKSYDSDRGASFQTWLNWQSRNVAAKVASEWFNLRRVNIGGRWQRVPRTVAVDEEGLEMLCRPVPDPADVREAESDSLVLWQEYEALAAEGKLSVTVHDMDGMTLAESALVLGIPVIRLRRLLDRNHGRLRKRLERQGVRPVEREPHFGRVRYDTDNTDYDDDWTGSQTAFLPD
jgi:DNA-directed RNA polymerase specialized sigma24 family protein